MSIETITESNHDIRCLHSCSSMCTRRKKGIGRFFFRISFIDDSSVIQRKGKLVTSNKMRIH